MTCAVRLPALGPHSSSQQPEVTTRLERSGNNVSAPRSHGRAITRKSRRHKKPPRITSLRGLIVLGTRSQLRLCNRPLARRPRDPNLPANRNPAKTSLPQFSDLGCVDCYSRPTQDYSLAACSL